MGDKNVLTVSGHYKNIKTVCDFVAAGAKKAGMHSDDVFHVELACDEACTNVIEHAYGGEDRGDIQVVWEVVAQDFVITLHDNGRSFNPAQVPSPLTNRDKPEELKVGGLGLHFMRKLMDDVQFEFDPQRGNTLTMTKQIK